MVGKQESNKSLFLFGLMPGISIVIILVIYIIHVDKEYTNSKLLLFNYDNEIVIKVYSNKSNHGFISFITNKGRDESNFYCFFLNDTINKLKNDSIIYIRNGNLSRKINVLEYHRKLKLL